MSARDGRGFALAESSPLRLGWVVLPLVLTLGYTVYSQLDGRPLQSVWGVDNVSVWSTVALVGLGVVLGGFFFRREVSLEKGTLIVHSTLYSRRVAVSALQLDRAEVIDLKRHPRWSLRCKSNGYSVPGFHSGHYRLRDGSKGFVLATRMDNVLALPVSGGATLLLSVESPQALLDALAKAQPKVS